MISSEEGSMKILTPKDTTAWRNPWPLISNPGVHLLKPENVWTSLSAPGLTDWKKWPVKNAMLCFLLEAIKNYTELQTPLEQEIQQANLCVILITSSRSGHALWGGTVGILEAFC